MDISHDFTTIDNRALTNLSSTCFISPKATGIVSLILQFTLLIISVLVVLFFFYHAGGYEYMSWNENSTTLEPIPHLKPLDSSADYSHSIAQSEENSTETQSAVTPLETNANHNEINSGREIEANTTNTLKIEQFPNTTIHLEFLGAHLDMLELIRISTLIYVAISVLWLTSIAFLLLSIKFEILDMVFINAVFLTVASTYAFVHALFIAALLYNQCDLSWRMMAIVIGCAVTLICTTVLCAVALTLVIAWYRYIVYMNNTEKCFCIHGIISLVTKAKREPQATQEYAMPNVTRHSELPYADERQQNNFSSF